jgi:hypothetical protein
MASEPTDESDIRNAALEEAAKMAECHFDDRGNGRSGHHSEMDWTDGYQDATRGAAAAIRALKSDPAPVPDPKPFTFPDPARQLEWERQRKERGE